MVSSINSENVVVQGSNQVERFVRSVPDMIAAKAIEFLLRPDHGFINDNNEKLNLLEKIETTSIEVRNNPDNQENAVITYSQDFTIFDHNTNEKSRKPFLMIPISLFKEAQKIICNDLKINANGEVVIKVSHGIQAQNISICSEDFIRIMDRNFINGSLRDMRWLKIPNFERTIEWYNIFTDQCKIIVDGDVVLIGKKGIINNMGIIKAKNIVRRSEGNIVDEATNKTGALYPYNVELQEPPGWLHQISRPITASYEALEDIIVDTPNGEIIEYGTDRIAGNDIIYRAIKTSSLQVFTNELHNQLNHHFKCIPIPKSPLLKGRLVKLQTQQSIVTNNIILCDTVEFDGDLELKCGKGLSTTVLTTSQSQKLGGVSVGNTETTIQINEEIVVPTVIKVNNLIGRNEGKLKLEGTIGEICHMYLGKKDLIEKAAYKRTKTYIHQESYGFCLPKINMDPILQAIEGVHAADDDLSKITSYVNTARVLVDTATDAVRLTHLETYSNPITTMVSTLLGRYVSSMGFVAQTTDTVIDRTVAVQSRMKVGVLQADNNLTHLEGIWDVDEAHIKTAQFEMVAPENTTDSETHTESFSVMFSPAAMVAGCCTPTIGYAGNSANRHEMTHSPAMFRAKKLFLQCNDAVFSGAQVQSKIVEMLVSGNLTVKTLKGMFSEHLENKSFQAALRALPSASGAPESLYKNCIDCISEIVGTERFYLEVGNTLYKKGAFVGLRPEGYVMQNPDDEQIIANRIQEDEVHEEYFHHRPMAIFDTIQATLGLMNSIDEFRQTWNHINSQSSVNVEDIEPEEKEEQDKQNEENAEKIIALKARLEELKTKITKNAKDSAERAKNCNDGETSQEILRSFTNSAEQCKSELFALLQQTEDVRNKLTPLQRAVCDKALSSLIKDNCTVLELSKLCQNTNDLFRISGYFKYETHCGTILDTRASAEAGIKITMYEHTFNFGFFGKVGLQEGGIGAGVVAGHESSNSRTQVRVGRNLLGFEVEGSHRSNTSEGAVEHALGIGWGRRILNGIGYTESRERNGHTSTQQNDLSLRPGNVGLNLTDADSHNNLTIGRRAQVTADKPSLSIQNILTTDTSNEINLFSYIL